MSKYHRLFFSPKHEDQTLKRHSPECFESGAGYLDFHHSVHTDFVVSERFRDLIDRVGGSGAHLDLRPAKVGFRDEVRDYFLLHFAKLVDVLDRSVTLYATGSETRWIRPVIREHQAEGLHLFQVRPNTIAVFVSDDFKVAAEAAGLSGLEFSPALSR
jgi:hypothetical protein